MICTSFLRTTGGCRGTYWTVGGIWDKTGKEPVSLINRNVQSYEIIDTFEDENPTYQGCVDNCDF